MLRISKDEASKLGLTEKPDSPIGRKWKAQAVRGSRVRKRGCQPHQQLVNSAVEYLNLKGIVAVEFKQYEGPGPKGGWIRCKAKGWPDIIGIVPEYFCGDGLVTPKRKRIGIFIGVEVKVGRDKQSLEQREAQRRIEAAGGRYVLIHSMDDLE